MLHDHSARTGSPRWPAERQHSPIGHPSRNGDGLPQALRPHTPNTRTRVWGRRLALVRGPRATPERGLGAEPKTRVLQGSLVRTTMP